MHWKLMFPSTFIGAEDLHGKDVTLTIRRVIVEELQGQNGEKQKKPCAWFEESRVKAEKTGTPEKRLILNRTNAKVIAKLYGSEVNGWSGKKITLYPTTTMAFGEQKDCIRVRESAPSGSAPTAELEPATSEQGAP